MPINEEIREKEVRVIGPDGSPLGIMSSKEALQIAQRENLDLVNISPKAVPPVCKIMNYGKYRFEQAKREKEAKKKQKTVEIKEIRLSLKIDTHDFETKVNQAKKFLEHATASRLQSVSVDAKWLIRSLATRRLSALRMPVQMSASLISFRRWKGAA